LRLNIASIHCTSSSAMTEIVRHSR